MMRKFVTSWASVLCIFGLAGSAIAATVTPSSAADYIFSTPLFPASISGKVIGAPPEYYEPRGEDVEWLFEALEERLALESGEAPPASIYSIPQLGKWSLSETNRFYTWATAVDASGVTNVVVGYSLVTNAQHAGISVQNAQTMFSSMFYMIPALVSSGNSGYFDSDVALATSARAAYDSADHALFTNVSFTITYTNELFTTNVFFEMQMTNGATSVYTNRWTATYLAPVTNISTNVWEAVPLDYCHTGDGRFPRLDIGTSAYTPISQDIVSKLTNAYSVIRRANRLADDAAPTNMSPTTMYFRRLSYSEPGFSTNSVITTTNSSGVVKASYYLSGSWTKGWAWDNDENKYVEWSDSVFVSEDSTPTYLAHVPTRFKSSLVTTGNTERVEIEAAFAVVDFTYSSSHSVGEYPNIETVTDEDVRKICVVPILFEPLDTSLPVARGMVTLNSRSLCVSAASAAGVRGPPDADGYTPGERTSSTWLADVESVVLIYRTKPSSKFTGW